MTKLYFKKIERCSECPQYHENPPHCKFNDIKIITDNIPNWCHLANYEEKIEANESERVWIKIRGR
jgi:hypothetical protein